MTGTAQATPDAKLCEECGAAFREDDDKRYNQCAGCRNPLPADAPETETASVANVPLDESGVEAIVLDHKAEDAPAPVPRDYFWCGVTRDAPAHYFTLGGINFQKYKGDVRTQGDGNQQFIDDTADGVIHHLAEENVALIKLHATGKVIRGWRQEVVNALDGEHPVFRGDVLSANGQGKYPYNPQDGDIPLGCFVYMVKVRNKTDRPAFPDEHPPTMVKRPKGMSPK